VLGYNDSICSPIRPQDQAAFLEALQAYYKNHPMSQVPELNLTAAATAALLAELTTEQTRIAAQLGAVLQAKNIRDENWRKMNARMVGLRKELSQLMGPSDPRWLNFGFPMPAAAETPEPVRGVVATMISPSIVAMKWDHSSRTSRYRVWKQVLGTDEYPVAIGLSADHQFNFEGPPAGATIDLYVSAANEAGESALSTKVTVVTPVFTTS
jgi:hypothetical protein